MGRTCEQIHAFGAVESLGMFVVAVVKWISTSLTVTEELFKRDTWGKRVSFCVTECRCMAWPFEEPTEIRNLRFAYNIQEEKNSPRMSWRAVNHGQKKTQGNTGSRGSRFQHARTSRKESRLTRGGSLTCHRLKRSAIRRTRSKKDLTPTGTRCGVWDTHVAGRRRQYLVMGSGVVESVARSGEWTIPLGCKRRSHGDVDS